MCHPTVYSYCSYDELCEVSLMGESGVRLVALWSGDSVPRWYPCGLCTDVVLVDLAVFFGEGLSASTRG